MTYYSYPPIDCLKLLKGLSQILIKFILPLGIKIYNWIDLRKYRKIFFLNMSIHDIKDSKLYYSLENFIKFKFLEYTFREKTIFL